MLNLLFEFLQPAKHIDLAVPKFPPAVQAEPLYSSVAALDYLFLNLYPPKPKPAVCVPAFPKIFSLLLNFPHSPTLRVQ
jgi:hypothetical protein